MSVSIARDSRGCFLFRDHLTGGLLVSMIGLTTICFFGGDGDDDGGNDG